MRNTTTMELLTKWHNQWWKWLIWKCHDEEIGEFYSVWFSNSLQAIIIQETKASYPAYCITIAKNGNIVKNIPLQKRLELDGLNPDVVVECLQEIAGYHAASLAERTKNIFFHLVIIVTGRWKIWQQISEKGQNVNEQKQ